MSRYSRIIAAITGIFMVSGLVGCATFHSPFGKSIPKATAADPAIEILCLWQQGDGQDPDGKPCKGFTGQVLFLSRKSSAPVQVEGQVRIYLFDDLGATEEEKIKPMHQYDFDSGSWNILLGKTSLGPTYTVFVPYTRRGVTEANCSLRIRLKPKHGPVIFSEFTNMPLSGSKKTLRGDDAKPITNEEVDRLAAEALTSTLRRTTTISTAPNPKVIENGATKIASAESNQVQQASYNTSSDSTKTSAEAERIRQLELRVQQLMEQTLNNAVSAPPPSNQPDAEPARLEEEPNQFSERLRLNPRRKARQKNEQESSQPVTPRRSHPLDDDQPKPAKSLKDDELKREPAFGDPFDSDN
jgi:hypothetical protein